jgi:hypothetical protein
MKIDLGVFSATGLVVLLLPSLVHAQSTPSSNLERVRALEKEVRLLKNDISELKKVINISSGGLKISSPGYPAFIEFDSGQLRISGVAVELKAFTSLNISSKLATINSNVLDSKSSIFKISGQSLLISGSTHMLGPVSAPYFVEQLSAVLPLRVVPVPGR